MSRIGEAQVRILTEEGVEPQNIYVGHINQTLDPDYHRELARLGVWLGWDINNAFGAPLPPWEQRAEYLKVLLDEGIESNMMLSHDWNVVLSRLGSSGFPSRTRPRRLPVAQQQVHSHLMEMECSRRPSTA